MKDDKPLFTNLVNQIYLHYAADSRWYASNKGYFDANKTFGWYRSVELGLGHPLRAQMWEMQVGGEYGSEWEEQSTVKVITKVCV